MEKKNKVKRIRYKEIILRALAERADATIETLFDMTLAMCATPTGSKRQLYKIMSPNYHSSIEVKFFSNLISENALRVTIARLKSEGLIESRERGVWKITSSGKNYANDYIKKEKENPATMPRLRFDEIKVVVSFDIPEMYREERMYLRRLLLEYGFVPLQKSVWVGGDPLPEEALREILRKKLEPFLCIFSVKKGGTIKDILDDLEDK